MKLRISPDLALPADTVTSTLIVFGGKGMGKTNLGSVLVEELQKHDLRWSYLDPLGVAWGLRHSADGKGKGIECVILGGSHGDIPIEPTGGAVVADLVVDEPGSVIIDFSRKPNGEMWSIGEKTRFITEYTKRLFQRQGGLINARRREPIFQILDEAARYIPQIIPHGNPQLAECMAAWETLVEEGRNIGIGVGLLTQRSARIAKSVTEIADAMFSFRIVGPNSIDAVTDWLGAHVPKKTIDGYIETVRALERGRCLIVSPGWLQYEGVIRIRMRETFDSSATPKPGERTKKVTGAAAKPDLAKYEARMKETIERAKENDPGALKARIRQLEGEVKKSLHQPVKNSLQTAKPDKRLAPMRALLEYAMKILVKVQAFGFEGGALKPEEVTAALELAAKEVSKRAEAKLATRSKEFEKLKNDVTSVIRQMKKIVAGEDIIVDVAIQRNEPVSLRPPNAPPVRRAIREHIKSNGNLPEGELKILKAASQYSEGAERKQLTILTGYKRSTRDAYIARLQAKNFVVTEGNGGRIQATEEGIVALGDNFEQLPMGAELQEYWLNELPEGEAKILRLLVDVGKGGTVDRETITESTGFKRSTRDAYLSRMAARHIVESVSRGEVKASENLFD